MTDFQALIAAAPDPDTAALRLDRMREDAGLRAELDALPEAVAPHCMNIIGYSNFLFNYLCRNPDSLRLLGQPCELNPEQLDGAQDYDALRRFKYEQLLKITWMDVSGAYPYQIILDCLSQLADMVICKAFDLSFTGIRGQPADCVSVFAMGKLGASELNYSSDVDLIYACSNYDDVGMKSHELQGLLAQGLRQFSKGLETPAFNGFLYRVDLKLRPWGKGGPLFLSVDETENYYAASTEAWERLTWLRARCVAGNRKLGHELLARIRPFVFIRSLSADDLERFITIKGEMAKVRARSGEWHVKLGRGGIRDIEFFIQILQLVSAAKHTELQTTNTLTILESLRKLKFIDPDDEQDIKRAYLFLRRLENRLQMADEKQAHALPDEAVARLRVARSLDGGSGASDDEIMARFEQELAENRAIAERYFEKILPEAKETAVAAGNRTVVSYAGAWNKVQAELSFTRWLEVCEKERWGDRPADKALLINVFGASWYFTRYIFFRGHEIAELFDNYQDKTISAAEMDQSLLLESGEQDMEHHLNVISSVKNQWMLLLLIRFLQGEMALPEVERNLTLLAERVLHAMLAQVAEGNPQLFANLAVLGMGRMAGYEMIFGSDLDLIFLYRPHKSTDTADVARQLQGLLRRLATVSPSGLLYEVDMRLRPHGSAGSLITSMESFMDYHHSERAIWERQMMTRCRPVYDPEGIGVEAMQAIDSSIYARHDTALLQDEIVKMRELIEETLGSPRNKYEIKRGKGGIMDIDFISHFLQLGHGYAHAPLKTASTRVALQRLADLNYLDTARAEFLLDAYNFLKKIEICMRLIDLKPSSSIPADHKQNAVLSRGMGYAEDQTEAFMAKFSAVTERVRDEFKHLLG